MAILSPSEGDATDDEKDLEEEEDYDGEGGLLLKTPAGNLWCTVVVKGCI